ncbi:MAG: FtsX-like permease family protein [Acidobacteria bacterium]|nr:FtsX-like permease family protein [Acidobacteriota bacterium]
MSLRRTAARLLALLRPGRLDRELDDEIRAHLEMAEQDALAAGMTPEQARRAARRQFGGIEPMKQEHRDSRSLRWIESLLRDFRHGLAGLVRDPGFTVVAVSVLALGIGANVAVFSLVDAVLLQPLPFPEPDRIVRVWQAPRPGVTNATSVLDFLDWRRLADSFEALAAEQTVSVALTGAGEPQRLTAKAVTSDYFRVFPATPLLGRTFLPGEDQPGAARVALLSHAAWQTYFGGDPDILSRRPVLDGEPHQVIGVLPPGPFDRDRAELWEPLAFEPGQQTRDFHWPEVHGRLRRGATLARAREQMETLNAALVELAPPWKRDWGVVVEPLQTLLVGDNLRQSIFVAFGAVAMVLLIACANVANLLLAKGAARRKELAMRAALGAGRGRLAAQLLTESFVLCLLGGVAGVAVAALLLQVAKPVLPAMAPFAAAISLNLRALGFAAAVALGVTLLIGALPALQTNLGKLSLLLNQASRGFSDGRSGVRRAIVVGEIALSLVLLCGAVLFLRSLVALQSLETGVRIDHVITLSMNLPLTTYPDAEAAGRFYAAVAERLDGAPGVEKAALASHLPLRWIGNGEGLVLPGLEKPVNVRLKRVNPGYFDLLEVPVLSGRDVQETDRLGAPHVILINETLAAQLADVAGVTDPIGKMVKLSYPFYETKGGSLEDVEIVGVIRNEKVSSPGSADPAVAYAPMAQLPRPSSSLLVRTPSDPYAVLPTIRAAIGEIDPNLPLGDIITLQQVRDGTLSGASRPTWVVGVFAAVAALLAAVGLYGVLSQTVAQRRREIGIRMALGARSQDVVAQVLRNALRLALIGVAVGLAGVVSLTRLVQSLLFGVSALDPLAIACACVAMTLLGLLAGFVPARRASRVEPTVALREEG